MTDQQASTGALPKRLAVEQATNGRLAAALFTIANTVRIDRLDNASREDLVAELEHTAVVAATALNEKTAAVRREYEVLWHGDSDGIVMHEAQIGHLSRALRIGPKKIGDHGITRFTVQFCTHVAFDDGSTWISGWEPVDYRGTLFPCPACGATVFRASGETCVIDAEPDPAGELVLIPNVEHGREPGAIHDRQRLPGQSRYRQHHDNHTKGGVNTRA